ncbi:MAG: hypothetical protein ACE5KF_01150 [Kiloniellaceae bacterium]
MLTCYPSPGKRKAMKLCQAFAEGCGGRVAALGERNLRPGAAFFYGMTEHTLPLIEQCQAEGREWYYADNAYYFGRGRYFRVTRKALQHDGSGDAGPERFEAFGRKIKPWKRDGRHVLIATQSELFYRFRLGISRDEWTRNVVEELRAATDRGIRICDKPVAARSNNAAHGASFEADLEEAWGLVTHSSSTAVKALLEGVPVFCTGACMASRMGLSDLSRIENPRYPGGREQWLCNLAANQWTKAEMRDGTCWRQLSDDR